MDNKERREEYTYWKVSWGKWVCLAAGALNLFSLFDHLSYYKSLVLINVFKDEELESILAQGKMMITLDALLMALLFGVFFIGCFVKSERAMHRAVGVFLLLLGAAHGAASAALGLFAMPGWSGRLNIILVLLQLVCGGYELRKSFK